MIKALPPPSYSRTAEILSRYRPIAPKPDALPSASATGDGSLAAGSSDGKIQQSPYLRTHWPQLQARPMRTRKRGRAPAAAFSSPTCSSKRHRSTAPAAHASIPRWHEYAFGLNHAVAALAERGTGMRSLATLPLLPESDTASSLPGGLDYQKEEFVMASAAAVPEEKDLLRQLQVPCTASHLSNTNTADNTAPVISPRPVRPVGSSIVVGRITEYPAIENPLPLPRKALEVEEEVEAETLPAVVSDSNGRVRLANSAYKEMVGQPECPWLESVVIGGKSRRARISGDVILSFCEDVAVAGLAGCTAGFQCLARIEWGSKASVNAACEVGRLSCESKDYVFNWRFHCD